MGVGGPESTGSDGVRCAGGIDGEGCEDSSCCDSCWLGEVDEVREVAELVGTWNKKMVV